MSHFWGWIYISLKYSTILKHVFNNSKPGSFRKSIPPLSVILPLVLKYSRPNFTHSSLKSQSHSEWGSSETSTTTTTKPQQVLWVIFLLQNLLCAFLHNPFFRRSFRPMWEDKTRFLLMSAVQMQGKTSRNPWSKKGLINHHCERHGTKDKAR